MLFKLGFSVCSDGVVWYLALGGRNICPLIFMADIEKNFVMARRVLGWKL